MGEITLIDNILVIGTMVSAIIGIYIGGKIQEHKERKAEE